MPKLNRVRLPIEETAELFRVQPGTIRRRLRARELHAAETIGASQPLVRLDGSDWVRAEDAASMLDVSTSTVRAGIHRGVLNGRREKHGRWFVELRSVLEDPRCRPEVLAVFTGEPAPDPPAPADEEPRREHRLRRDVHVLLDQGELELLELGRSRHGSIREAVIAGLRSLRVETLEPDEVDELRAAHDLHEEQARRFRGERTVLAKQLRERPVESLVCLSCEKLVPIDEADFVDMGDGTIAIVHAKHSRGRGGAPRKGSVMGVQRLPELAP